MHACERAGVDFGVKGRPFHAVIVRDVELTFLFRINSNIYIRSFTTIFFSHRVRPFAC